MSHHKPEFDIHEDALAVGASVFVQLVLDRLKSACRGEPDPAADLAAAPSKPSPGA